MGKHRDTKKDLKIGKVYSFNVVKKGINDNGYYSILQLDPSKKKYSFPFHLRRGRNYDLKVTGTYVSEDERKYKFSLEHELVREYTKGESYEFQVIGLTTIEIRNGVTQIFLEVIDKLGVKRTVKPYNWQYNEKGPTVDEIYCKINIKGNKLFLNQEQENIQHPHFDMGENYLLDVIGVEKLKESTINILNLSGPDNITYSVKAHFFQHSKKEVEDKIKCIYKGLDSRGEVILEQLNDGFIGFDSVFEDRIGKEKLFREIKNQNPDLYGKLEKDYDKRENIWVFSVCEGLKNLIENHLNSYNYKGGKKYIQLLIVGEKWILKSGFLKTFSPKKRDFSKHAAESIIQENISKKESINLLLNYEAKDYLNNFFENLDAEIKQDEYNKKLKRVLEILRLTNRTTIDSKYIIDILRKLENLGLLGKGEKRKFIDIVSKRSLILRNKIFSDELPNFEDEIKSKKDSFQEYSKLLYLYSFLLFKLKNIAESANGLAKYFRALSFITDDKEDRYNYIIGSILILKVSKEIEQDELGKYFQNKIIPPNFEEVSTLIDNLVKESRENDEYIKRVAGAYEKENKLTCNIVGINDDYIEVSYGDVFGIIPGNLYLDAIKNNDFKEGINVRVIQVYSDAKLFIGSKINTQNKLDKKEGWKLINSKADKSNKKKESLINELALEDNLIGSVKNVNDKIGVFVNLGFIDGLIPTSKISWKREVTPSDYFSEDQIIRCSVQDKKKNEITLSTRNYFKNPWDKYEDSLKKNSGYVAKVVNIEDFGVFFDLAPKFTGLLHIKKIDLDVVPAKYFSKGDTYVVYVNSYNSEKRQIGIDKCREVKPSDFSNQEIINLWQKEAKEDENWVIKDDLSGQLENSIFQLGYNFRNIANILNEFSEKIDALEWSKFFFSINRSKHSYLANYYIKYFRAIEKFAKDDSINNYDMDYVNSLVSNIENDQIIKDKFPFIRNVKGSLNILSKYADSSYEALDFLLKKAYDNGIKEVNQNLARLIISNNIIKNKDIDESYYLRNKKTIINYLENGVLQLRDLDEDNDTSSEEEREIKSVIEQGENKNIEFKSTLGTPILTTSEKKEIRSLNKKVERFRKKDNKKAMKAKNEEIEEIKSSGTPTRVKFSAMKTIASFANSNGGTLLIGVDDNKNIIGLEHDYNRFGSDNKRDSIKKLLDDTIGDFIADNIHNCIHEVNIINVKDFDILQIKVSPSTEPIYLQKNKDGMKGEHSFFVRAAASVRKLDAKEARDYIKSSRSLN